MKVRRHIFIEKENVDRLEKLCKELPLNKSEVINRGIEKEIRRLEKKMR